MPFVACAGALGAVLGALARDRGSVAVGSLGAALTSYNLIRTTTPHRQFEHVFGADWQARIPPALGRRLAARRWQFPAAHPPPRGSSVRRDLSYGTSPTTGQPLRCDVYEPPAGVSRTGLVILTLNRTWHAYDKGMMCVPIYRRLAGQGHVVVDLSVTWAPLADLVGMMREIKRAIAWIKSSAAHFDVNPDRVVLMGSSHGAHLMLLAAYTPNHPTFQSGSLEADTSIHAVVAFSGISDLAAFFDEYAQIEPGQPRDSAAITDDLRPRVFDRSLVDKLAIHFNLWPVYRHPGMPGGPLLLIDLLGGTPRRSRKPTGLAPRSRTSGQPARRLCCSTAGWISTTRLPRCDAYMPRSRRPGPLSCTSSSQCPNMASICCCLACHRLRRPLSPMSSGFWR